MADRKKRNLKLEIQEIMDRTSRHEREYREQQLGRKVPVPELSLRKFFKSHGDLHCPNFNIPAVETGEELEQLIQVLNGMVESGAFTIEEIEAIRDGKITLEKMLAEAQVEGEGERIGSDEPPKPAEYLAYMFLPKTDRETLLGDLTEEYPRLVTKFGLRLAKIYFYKHVIWSIWPLVRKAVVKWGLFGWVVELIRKIGS